ncbi:hypothetical protein GC093_03815 [Paenibacillus sp. LMG 31456]|uniref:Uncharacterized protein n=1 Tax=Paenibacillus foliorum TaxID=2654974 RepID=A0A972JZ44_9BACL|nr:hypothetical protein [Paenibacillus foliorum]NOU92365.1 hypothetical protein [Paenibacillus foliorum]
MWSLIGTYREAWNYMGFSLLFVAVNPIGLPLTGGFPASDVVAEVRLFIFAKHWLGLGQF